MPRKIFRRFLPDAEAVKQNRLVSCLGEAIHDSDLWALNKHSVAGAFFIGVFCAFQPIPLQTVMAAFLAMVFKRNLPLSVALVFISNPLTMAPIFYFNYYIGSLFMGETVLYDELAIDDLWTWLTRNLDLVGKPLFLGSLICGLVFALLSYWGIHAFWIWHVRDSWRKRKTQRKNGSSAP